MLASSAVRMLTNMHFRKQGEGETDENKKKESW
jgi:hypothetical protein